MTQFWPTPNPRTWTAKDHVLAPELRTDVSDVVGFHTNRATFAATQSVGLNQSIANTTWTGVTLDSALYDNTGGHSTTTNPSRYVCQVSGWYLAIGNVAWSSSATGSQNEYVAGVRVNGSNSSANLFEGAKHPGANSSLINPGVFELVQLSAGDYVELGAWQSSGGAVTITSTAASGSPSVVHRPAFQLIWVAAGSGTAGLSVPAPITWVNGATQQTAAIYNAQIRDVVRFLTYPPIVRLVYSGTTPAGQTIANNTATAIKWDTAAADPYTGWAGTGTNPTRWTAPVSGKYFCAGYYAASANITGKRGVGLRVNGTTTFNGQQIKPITASTHDAGTCVVAARTLRLSAGDYVEVMGLQSSGGTLGLSTGTSTCKFIAAWIGS